MSRLGAGNPGLAPSAFVGFARIGSISGPPSVRSTSFTCSSAFIRWLPHDTAGRASIPGLVGWFNLADRISRSSKPRPFLSFKCIRVALDHADKIGRRFRMAATILFARHSRSIHWHPAAITSGAADKSDQQYGIGDSSLSLFNRQAMASIPAPAGPRCRRQRIALW